jgi:hypothetical protein
MTQLSRDKMLNSESYLLPSATLFLGLGGQESKDF